MLVRKYIAAKSKTGKPNKIMRRTPRNMQLFHTYQPKQHVEKISLKKSHRNCFLSIPSLSVHTFLSPSTLYLLKICSAPKDHLRDWQM